MDNCAQECVGDMHVNFLYEYIHWYTNIIYIFPFIHFYSLHDFMFFWIFKDRNNLFKYLPSHHRSILKIGLFIWEIGLGNFDPHSNTE